MATQSVDCVITSPGGGYNVGDSVDTTMLTAMLKSSAPTIAYTGTAGAMTLDATITAPPFCKFKVGATTYDLSAAQGIQLNHNSQGFGAQFTIAAQVGPVSIAYLVQTNIDPNIYSAGNTRVDFGVLFGNTGSSVYDNYAIGAGKVTPGHRLETSTASATTAQVVNALRWIILKYTVGNPGTGTIRVFDPVTWQLLGSGTLANAAIAANINGAFFGSNNGSTSVFAGYFSWIKAVVVSLSGIDDLGVPIAPGTPTGFSASVISGTQVDLSWTLADTNLTGVQVIRDGAILATTSDTATTYSDTSCAPFTTYSYKLVAHNISFDSAATSAQVVTTTGPASAATSVANLGGRISLTSP